MGCYVNIVIVAVVVDIVVALLLVYDICLAWPRALANTHKYKVIESASRSTIATELAGIILGDQQYEGK